MPARGTPWVAMSLMLCLGTGCHHDPARSTLPVSEVQAPAVKAAPRPVADSAEKRLQDQINRMQEQIGTLTARTEALARFHGPRMGPNWIEKVQAAREQASRPAERERYLEATRALLARKLQSLEAELKVYQEFEASDPAIPRP